MTVQQPKAKKGFYDSVSPLPSKPLPAVSVEESIVEEGEDMIPDSQETRIVEVTARIPLYAFAYLEAKFTGPDALAQAKQAVELYGEKQEQSAGQTSQPTSAPQATQSAPVGMATDLSIVPEEFRRLMPQGVLTTNKPGFSKTTGKPFPKFTFTDESNGRQVSAWENDKGGLGWGKIGPIYVPKKRAF